MNMNRRLFRYLSRDILKGVGVFWLVMTIANIAATLISHYSAPNVIIATMINGDTISYAGSNLFAAFIFFIVYGIVIYYENFSLAAGFGVTRKNFYLHVMLNNIIIVAIFAVIQMLLIKIDNIVISNLGHKPMVDFGLFNMNDNIILNILLLGFSFLVCTSLSNLIGALQYRFGAKFWICFGIFVFLTSIFGSTTIGIISSRLGALMNAIVNGGFLIGTIVIILSYGIGFLLIRRVNVK